MTADDPTPTGHGLHEDAPRDAAEVLDPLGFGEAWMRTANAAMQNPQAMIHAGLRFWEGMAEATGAAISYGAAGEGRPDGLEVFESELRSRLEIGAFSEFVPCLEDGHVLTARVQVRLAAEEPVASAREAFRTSSGTV